MRDQAFLDRPPGDRDNAVGLARFVLSSMVVLSHSFHFFMRSNDLDPLIRLSREQYTLGRIAVDAFFVLSGFLVAGSWKSSRGGIDFLWRRATRIYPGFLTAILLTSLVAAPWLAARGGMPRPEVPSWADLLVPALTLDYVELAANGSVWVLRYDFFCYLLIAAAGWSGLLARRWPVAAMGIVSWLVYAYWFTSGADQGMRNQHPRFLTCFLAGAIAHAYRDRIPSGWSWVGASAVAMVLFLAPGLPFDLWPWQVASLAFPIFGTHLVLFACFGPGRRAGRAGWLGDFSYGLFLYAYPIQLVLVTAFRDRLDPFSHFLISWPTAILAAWASLSLIERPAMRLRSRRPPLRHEPPPPHFRPTTTLAEIERTA